MKKIFIAFAVFMLIISCGNNSKGLVEAKPEEIQNVTLSVPDREQNKQGYLTPDTAFQQVQEQEPEKTKQNQQISIPAKPDWDKKIIKTASLNIEIKDYNNYNSSLREKIKQVGGYTAQEEQSQSDYKIENTLIIKVPVDQFDNAVTLFTTTVEKLNEKKITSQDVTTEVVDTKSRLEAKKQVRQRYMDLLKQAKNMEEILNVQSEINGIQEDIESATGRIEYLGHSSSFSTINLTFYQVLNASAKDTDQPSFGTKLNNAFRTGWSWVGELFVGIVSIWPLLLMIFIAFIIYKRTRIPKAKQVV